jgi:transcriptional regulator with XRE-family HTH domain
MDNLLQEIGKRIRKKRNGLGISREKFSEVIGITPHFLAQIECGKKGMSTNTLYKICFGLHASADYILMGREEKNDISGLDAILENVDPEYLPYIERVVKSLVLVLSRKK